MTPGSTLWDIVLKADGGCIPETGEFNQRVWSMLLGVTEKTFKEWIEKYHVPHRRPGNDVYVDARDFQRSLPRVNAE